MYVRFQNAHGDGLFNLAGRFQHDLELHGFSRADERRFHSALDFISRNTNPPPASVYADARCRFPRTWFKASARQHVCSARMVAYLLNKHGTPVWPHASSGIPGALLWQDDVQIVVRPHREYRAPPTRSDPRPGWSGDRTTIRRQSSAFCPGCRVCGGGSSAMIGPL